MISVRQFAHERALLIPCPKLIHCADKLAKELKSVFHNLELITPGSLDELRGLIRKSRSDFPLLIVAGGDGTVHQAVNYMDLQMQKILALPGGRGNDLVRALGLPLSISEFLKKIKELKPRRIDLGRVNSIYYHNSGGIGLDASVLSVMARTSGIFAKNYVLAFLRSLGKIEPLNVQVETDAIKRTRDYWWIVAMNGRTIGGGIPICPMASPDDGLFDVVAIRRCAKLNLLAKLPLVLMRKHLRLKEVDYWKTPFLKLTGFQMPVSLALDGEVYTCKGAFLEFEIRPCALTIYG